MARSGTMTLSAVKHVRGRIDKLDKPDLWRRRRGERERERGGAESETECKGSRS